MKEINIDDLITLDLRGNDISDAGAEKIASALKTNSTLTTLNLEDNRISDAGAEKIASALKTNSTLTTLKLCWNQISAAGAEKIASALKTNRTLTTLDLSYNRLSAAGAEKIASALETNSTLTMLNLRDNRISDAGAEKIASALETNRTLTMLDLYDNQISDAGAEKIASALKTNRTLTTLKLCWNQISAAGAEKIALALKTNRTLITLNLSHNGLSAAGAEKIASALKANRILTMLDLSGNDISDAGAEKIASALKTNSTLTTLSLRDNRISAAGAEKIALALETNRTLTTLNLSSNDISAAGAEKIASALKTNSTLTTLDLGYNGLSAAGVEKIASTLKTNSTLTTLSLAHNGLSAAGAEKIALALKTNSTLITLELYANGISDAGAEKIALALKTNRTLTTLGLNGNRISDAGAEKIALALKTNSTLTTLDLGANGISAAGAEKINQLLDRNKEIARLRETIQTEISTVKDCLKPSSREEPEEAFNRLSATIETLKGYSIPAEAFQKEVNTAEAEFNTLLIQAHLETDNPEDALIHYELHKEALFSDASLSLAEYLYSRSSEEEKPPSRTIRLNSILALLQSVWRLPAAQVLICQIMHSLQHPDTQGGPSLSPKKIFGGDVDKVIPLSLIEESVTAAIASDSVVLTDEEKEQWTFMRTHLSQLSPQTRYDLCQLSPLQEALTARAGTSRVTCFEDLLTHSYPLKVHDESITLETIFKTLQRDVHATAAEMHSGERESSIPAPQKLDDYLKQYIESVKMNVAKQVVADRGYGEVARQLLLPPDEGGLQETECPEQCKRLLNKIYYDVLCDMKKTFDDKNPTKVVSGFHASIEEALAFIEGKYDARTSYFDVYQCCVKIAKGFFKLASESPTYSSTVFGAVSGYVGKFYSKARGATSEDHSAFMKDVLAGTFLEAALSKSPSHFPAGSSSSM